MRFVPRERLADRASVLRRELEERGLDVLVVTALPHLFYLLNLRASAGVAIVEREPPGLRLVIDFRYMEAVNRLLSRGIAPPELEVVRVEGTYDETLCRLLRRRAAARIAIEADHLSVRRWTWLQQALSVDLTPTVELVERARMRKDEHETQVLREAGAMLAAITPRVCRAARRGRTEIEVARDIERLIEEAGFERSAFDCIVASGPNGALPHAHPTDRKLAGGDLVILDFGGVHQGYCVDVSRTVSVGLPSAETSRWHRAVREAQAAAMAASVPGVLASEVDAAARAVLERYGLADCFGHGTGHGLGIDVHELPRVGKRREGPAGPDDLTLAPGMVYTIEPGVYVSDLGGVRIEDDVLMTAAGIEILTPACRALLDTDRPVAGEA
jgi:Xaa-Pro aminopeptidase